MSSGAQKTAATPSPGRRLALVVGVNEAPPSAYLARLQCAESSAAELSQVLQSSCDFELFMPPLLGEQATTAAVQHAIRKLALQRTAQDFLLFYFAGHGYPMSDPVEQRNIYLVTHDFDPAMIEDLGDEDAHLSLSWLNKILYKGTKAGSVLLLLDCCYAGNMGKLALDRPLDAVLDSLKYYFSSSSQTKGKSRATLAAAGRDAVAWERDGSSVMTSLLLDALRGACAEAVDDAGHVTLERLQGTLRKQMPSDQKLSFSGEIVGDSLILATHSNLSAQARRERELAAYAAQREQRLRAMFADHSGFMQDRLDSFVGRKKELAELRQRMDTLLSTGGYLTITGQPGQGKSSIIARLIESYGKEQGGLEHVAYHFIPLTPGADHQVVLLRNLMARLILKYDLSDLFLASESRTTLSDAFPRVLKEIADKGGREIIFIDGLDQLEAEHLGHRDLSFLPQGPGNPPNGIVFVLGTRPNDTLRPLELLKPHDPYLLPNLSRADFDLILQHRHVTLEQTLANRFYEKLEENALYLDLVAKELSARGSITSAEVEEIIQQIADNPENLFSLATDRLKQPETLWREVIKPVLGLLLVTSEPLARQQIKQLININAPVEVDSEQLNTGLERLGGLIVTDGQQRYNLFHLKFRDSLRQGPERPDKRPLFDVEDEQRWHTRFIAWCEQGALTRIWDDTKDPVEQGRRHYARQHYLTHLHHTHMWDKLFHILDEGAYGRAKVQHDPSARTYALDLDLGRDAATSAQWSLEETIQHLPRLWRYTLLRCSLASRADKYPVAAFSLMLLLGQETRVLGLAELITNLERRAEVFTLLASHVAAQSGREREAEQLFLQTERVIGSISGDWRRAKPLAELAAVLGQAGRWQEAERVIGSIPAEGWRAKPLAELAAALGQAGRWQEAERVIGSISDEGRRAKPLAKRAAVLGQAGHWQEAERVIGSISVEWMRAEPLAELAAVLRQAGRWQEAERIWQEAERVIGSISDDWRPAEVLAKRAAALGQARHWQEAERVIGSISDDWRRAGELAKLAAALGQAGRWQEAERVIGSISDEGSRANPLAELAAVLGQAGHWQEAERIWQEAERVIGSISDDWRRAGELAKLVAALGQARHWQEAERMWQEAERVIGSISDEGSRAEPLAELAAALGQARRWQEAERVWQEAERVIGSILDKGQRGEALAKLAGVLAQAGRWSEAERMIGSISDDWRRALALTWLAGALAQAQCWQEAERVIGFISGKRQRALALTWLAGALAQAQCWQEAERMIGSISNEGWRAEPLAELAGVLAQAGRWQEAGRVWQEAERVIGSISRERGQRGEALRNLADALAKHNEQERLLSLIHRWWLQADTRDEAIDLLPLAFGLIPLHPNIGMAFYNAFAWVDNFLHG
jgi:tetratricopeptide (TPR) repeat protein